MNKTQTFSHKFKLYQFDSQNVLYISKTLTPLYLGIAAFTILLVVLLCTFSEKFIKIDQHLF